MNFLHTYPLMHNMGILGWFGDLGERVKEVSDKVVEVRFPPSK